MVSSMAACLPQHYPSQAQKQAIGRSTKLFLLLLSFFWLTSNFYINAEHFIQLVILTPGLILVLPESGLPLVNHPHNIGSPPNNHVHSRTMVSCPSRPCDLLPVPSWQMEDGSTVTVLFSLVLSFLLLEHSETGGQLSSPQLLPSRAPLLSRSSWLFLRLVGMAMAIGRRGYRLPKQRK